MSAATKARIKFRGDLPWPLEQKLCQKYGFRVYSRMTNTTNESDRWIIMEKLKRPPRTLEVLVNGELPEDVQNTLISRCNRVVNCFLDPDAHKKNVIFRLQNIANTLPPQQKKFIEQWISNNLGEE
jgi:transposase-like protein